MTTITNRSIAFGCAALAVAALAGCTPGDAVAPTPPPTQETIAPVLEGPECLVGNWYVAEDQLQVFYDSVSAASGNAVVFAVDGDTLLSFDGARYKYEPDLYLTVTTGGVEGVARLRGTIAGDYTADATTLRTVTDTTDVEYSYSVGGVAQDASALFAGALADAPISGGEYECTADGPIIQFNNGSGRVPVQLVPRVH